jgi:hypothetical protein
VQRVELPVDAWLRGERRQTVHVAATPAITKIEIDPDAQFPDVDRRNQAWTPGR